jgi:hypothetical protein
VKEPLVFCGGVSYGSACGVFYGVYAIINKSSLLMTILIGIVIIL